MHYYCYPSVNSFIIPFDYTLYWQFLQQRKNGGLTRPLALNICFPNDSDPRDRLNKNRNNQYMASLKREILLVADAMQADDRHIKRMNWTGSILSFDKHRSLLKTLQSVFHLSSSDDWTVNLNVQDVNDETITHLTNLGFNDLKIKAENPSTKQLECLSNVLLYCSFNKIAIDLAINDGTKNATRYFGKLLRTVVDCNPDHLMIRIGKSLYRIAQAIEYLESASYVHLGIGHFSKSNSDLAKAQWRGRLRWEYGRYTAHDEHDMIGLGISATSHLRSIYCRNTTMLEDYHNLIKADLLPIASGRVIKVDDLVRRSIIEALLCHFEVDLKSISTAYLIDISQYFAKEMTILREFIADEIIDLSDDWLTITSKGKPFVYAVCNVFNHY